MTGEQRAVRAGETRGHLVVIEELEGRSRARTRRFRCRCIVERDGVECGNVVVRATQQLTADRFRGCDRCQREHNLKVRRAYGRSFVMSVR